MTERSKPDEFLPLFIGPYLKDTLHLSTEQHGAYLLLLMAYWVAQGPLPDDDAVLSAITKSDLKTWRKSLRKIVEKFFIISDGKWHQKKADYELGRAVGLVKSRSEAGKRGNEVRWQDHRKEDRKPDRINIANDIANGSQNDPILHKSQTISLSSSVLSSARTREDLLLLCKEARIELTPNNAIKAQRDFADLLSEGFDVQMDLMPAAKRAREGNQEVRSLKYLKPIAQEIRARRTPSPDLFENTDREGWRKRFSSFKKLIDAGNPAEKCWPSKWGGKRPGDHPAHPSDILAEFDFRVSA